MRKLFRNTLIASAVVAAGIAAGANNAMAVDSSPIEFNYTQQKTCIFGTPTKGILTLGIDSTGKARLSSSGTGNATISLSCNGGATIAVKELQETQANGMTRQTSSATYANVAVTSPSGGTASLYETGIKSAAINKTTAFTETLSVAMDLRFNQTILAPGAYIYKTVLTATPN